MSSPTPAGQMVPIGGDGPGIRRHATRFTNTANAIRDAVRLLQVVREASEEQQSEAVEALAGAIGDTRNRLHQLRDRYEVAGSQLTDFADVLEDAQGRANAAIDSHGASVSTVRGYEYRVAEANEARSATVDPAELQTATDAVTRYNTALTNARADELQARILHAQAVADVEAAGNSAASAISRAVDGDGLNDSWWDNVMDWVNDNAGWLKVVKDILTVVTTIVGVLSIFFPVLAPLALGLALLTAGLSFLLAASGDGSWIDFALDVVGVLTLGVGSAALAGIRMGSVALRGSRAVRLALTRPGAVFGSSLRQVAGNLFRRGLVGSARQPFQMVAREAASVIPARPGLLQVVTRQSTPWMTTIREADSVIIAEFDQLASQARLGAGGMIDDAIIGGANRLGQVYSISSKVGTGAEIANYTGMGLNYGDQLVGLAENAVGVDTPIGDIVHGAKAAYDFLPDLATGPLPTEWTAPVAR